MPDDIFEKARKAFDEEHFSHVINLLSSAPFETFPPKTAADGLYLLGVSLYQTGNVTEGVQTLKKGLSRNPHHAPTLDALGNYFADQGKHHAAISRYRAATAADPTLWEPYYHWAYLLKKIGSPKAAFRKFKIAIEKNPDHVESYLHAGDCAFQLGQFDEALRYYATAAQKGEPTGDLLTRIGNTYSLLGDRKRAMKAYQQSIAVDPMEGSGYENWGLLFHQQGKLKEAAEKYEEGLIHAPDSPTLLLRHGEVLLQMEKYKEAVLPLEKALKILEEKMEGEWALHWTGIIADCTYSLGAAKRKLGDEKAARKYLAMALKFSPNHLSALQELAMMRGIYREHHVKWEFVLEGKVNTDNGKVLGLRAYRIAAITLEEAMKYAKELEEDIQGKTIAKDVSHSEQIASYAGVLARGPLFLIGSNG